MRHRCELPWDGTFFVLRKLKPNSFFMSCLTLSRLTVTYCDSTNSLTTESTFWITFLSCVNFSKTECTASSVSSSNSSFCLTYSNFSGRFYASLTTLLTNISETRCLRAISKSGQNFYLLSCTISMSSAWDRSLRRRFLYLRHGLCSAAANALSSCSR